MPRVWPGSWSIAPARSRHVTGSTVNGKGNEKRAISSVYALQRSSTCNEGLSGRKIYGWFDCQSTMENLYLFDPQKERQNTATEYKAEHQISATSMAAQCPLLLPLVLAWAFACHAKLIHVDPATAAATAAAATTAPHWNPAYLQGYINAANAAGLETVNPTLLAVLYDVTGNTTYARAAADSLAAAASPTKPPWLKGDKSWDAPKWYTFDLNSTTFSEPDRFSGCTDYGLLAYRLLQEAGFDKQWTAGAEARFKHMHQTLCFTWFTGAWNQGTWMGLGNAILGLTYVRVRQALLPQAVWCHVWPP